jgi:tRNA G18 (ribose-2'-O)-methylase SpoU
MTKGYFAIGIENSKKSQNIGTLWRTAAIWGAAFIYTIGYRYKHQASDTIKSWRHIPLFNFHSLEDLMEHMPTSCQLIGIEMGEEVRPLKDFTHPKQACYVLGAEDSGLTKATIDCCQDIISLPGNYSLNVSVAGSIVMYHRIAQLN